MLPQGAPCGSEDLARDACGGSELAATRARFELAIATPLHVLPQGARYGNGALGRDACARLALEAKCALVRTSVRTQTHKHEQTNTGMPKHTRTQTHTMQTHSFFAGCATPHFPRPAGPNSKPRDRCNTNHRTVKWRQMPREHLVSRPPHHQQRWIGPKQSAPQGSQSTLTTCLHRSGRTGELACAAERLETTTKRRAPKPSATSYRATGAPCPNNPPTARTYTLGGPCPHTANQ